MATEKLSFFSRHTCFYLPYMGLSLNYAVHDRANTPVRPYKQTRGALNTHIPLSPWICNPRVLRQGFINPL